MNKTKTRFEVVPVPEVLEKAVELDADQTVERPARKKEASAVPVQSQRSVSERKPPPRHRE